MSAVRKITHSKPFRKVDDYLSRTLGGTNIGYRFHLLGWHKINQARKSYNKQANDRHPETTKAFKETGYAPKLDAYDPALIEAIKTGFAEKIQDKGNYVNCLTHGYAGDPDVRRLMNDPIGLVPELTHLIDTSVCDQIESYFGSYFRVLRIAAWRNTHVTIKDKSDDEVYSDFWHFDQRTTDVAKLFVNISDVTEDDGPFHIQSRQRSKELIDMGYKTRKDYGAAAAEMDHPDHVFKAVGSAGTGLYCNTELCLHRADIPKKGHYRDIVQFQFVPSDKPLADDWYTDKSIIVHDA